MSVTHAALVNSGGASSSKAILQLRIYNVVGIAFLWGKGVSTWEKVVKGFLTLFESTRTFRDEILYPGT